MAMSNATRPGIDDLEQERAGSRALSAFARVLNAKVLEAHTDGPLRPAELETKLGWAAKASLRVATATLCELGALSSVEPVEARRAAATQLTEAGEDLLAVAGALERWLSQSPFGPLPLWDTAGRGAVRALVAGWESTIVGAVAEEPRSLSELNSEIPEQSYPSLKRRLSRLRSASLVEPVNGRRRSPAHTATEWLRGAVGPLSMAGRWERRHAAEQAPPLTRQEIEAALLLALPLVTLPSEASGDCVLAAPAAEAGDGEAETSLAAVTLVVEKGRVVSSSSGAAPTPTTWALGTPDAWLDAMIDGNHDSLRLRGSHSALAVAAIRGIHESLFTD